ncbi:MAG TPA: DegT/DnrJ/EryC1/StrS family aminotransferase [Pirellulales bacterium]|jgi:perosamine synthetase|nr:DegT/DnrJ/EryC1/StrS family aminotransferase [Pirellulales bacterium]
MMQVPFFRPSISTAEIDEVVNCLRSGWLTTGPLTKRFEAAFAEAVGGKFAVAVNSCTAALHLAVEALGLQPGEGVLVPTETFAATAEIVRYQGGIPILVDCDPVTLHLDLLDAERKIADLRAGRLPIKIDPQTRLVGMIPVHVGGLMLDLDAVRKFAEQHQLWVVEDAAHSFPAAWRSSAAAPWQRCGENSSAVACFSFYANKTITTGEGGMAVTDDEALADRMRMMSLHGLSRDAWGRFAGGPWDYRIVAPGFKYNLTDVAAAIGVHQLARAETLRLERERLALRYCALFADQAEIQLPPFPTDRIHAWHLFPIQLQLEKLSLDRNAFIERLKEQGVGCSVHYRPLHLHPYYQADFGWRPEQFPVATRLFERWLSLPFFPGLTEPEQDYVAAAVLRLCGR